MCNFKIVFPSLAHEHIDTARQAIIKHGGSLDEKGNTGVFEIHIGIGKIAGNYVITGEEVEFFFFLIECLSFFFFFPFDRNKNGSP